MRAMLSPPQPRWDMGKNNVDKRILLSAIQSWVCADMGVRKLLECECPKLKDITRAAETREKATIELYKIAEMKE